MLPIDLSNKLALVTGGSGALGRVMVRTLAQAGADVIIAYFQNEGQAKDLLAEIEALGRQGLAIQVDVTDQSSIFNLRDQVAHSLGSPNIIVNNAVIQYKWVSVLAQAAEDYDSQFRACVLHNVFMAKAFVPAMIEQKWGRVIGINTECAMQNFVSQSAYTAGKRGMDGVLRVLAKEVGEYNITVNQVAPGWTISDKSPVSESAGEEAYRQKVPMQRRGTDQEIANVVTFLASDLASYVTGVYIPVCGGNVMPAI